MKVFFLHGVGDTRHVRVQILISLNRSFELTSCTKSSLSSRITMNLGFPDIYSYGSSLTKTLRRLVSGRKEYRYKKFSCTDEVRFLERAYKDQDGVWVHRLIHTTLSRINPFTAISWVWGDSTRQHELRLEEGRYILINDNLAEALDYLWERYATNIVWIDQVCINQADIGERNHQVRLMRSIYMGSKKVLIWLGINNELETSFDEITRYGTSRYYCSSAKFPDEAAMSGAYERSMLWLASRLWFFRSWTVQEYILSRDAGFLIGTIELVASDILYILDRFQLYLNRRKGTVHLQLPALQNFNQMIQRQSHFYHVDQNATLKHHFANTLSELAHSCEASDPRDHVYAFLGLAWNREVDLVPRYEQTYIGVLQDTAVALLNGRCGLDILDFLNRRPTTHTLPSWVPDWHMAPTCNPIMATLPSDRDWPVIWSERVDGQRGFEIRELNRRLSLHIRGRLVGRIQEVLTRSCCYGLTVCNHDCEWAKFRRDWPQSNKTAVVEDLIALRLALSRIPGLSKPPDRKGLEEICRGVPESLDMLTSMLSHAPMGPGNFTERGSFSEISVPANEFPELCKENRLSTSSISWDRVGEVAKIGYLGLQSRKMFICDQGYVGLGEKANVGDTIFLLEGCKFPVVLRPTRRHTYIVVESCFYNRVQHLVRPLKPAENPDLPLVMSTAEAVDLVLE